MRRFSLKNKLTERTILKYEYLKEHEISYNNSYIRYEMARNYQGQYTFKTYLNNVTFYQNLQKFKNEIKVENNTAQQQFSSQFKELKHQNKKSTSGVKNLTEFSKKKKKSFPQELYSLRI